MSSIRGLLLSLLFTVLAACVGGSSTPQTSVTVTPTQANVMVGQQIQLTATIKDASGAVLSGRTVIWTSSNNAIATVDATGLVKALALGQATIAAGSDGQSASATLTTTTGLAFATVSAGDGHTCGVTPTGSAYCWGDNSSGQLGNGATANSATPVLVSGAITFATVSAGASHTCGVTTSSVAYCWGSNSSGQIGNGATANGTTPAPVSGGMSFVTVSAGSQHTCGVTVDGFPFCWGSNSSGQLGNSTTVNSATPVPVSGGLPFASVSAGGRHTCGLAGKYSATTQPVGTLYCWGDNTSGQLGNGTTVSSSIPVQIPASTPFHLWSASVSAASNHTCAVAFENGFAMTPVDYCWGDNSSGQLGNGTMTSSPVPVSVGVFNSTVIGAGTFFSCAVDNTSRAFCWGNNNFGQLGNGTSSNSPSPVVVVGGLTVVRVSAGGRHACGIVSSSQPSSLTVSGAVYCWGDNSSGQLGNSWTSGSSVPINVAGPS